MRGFLCLLAVLWSLCATSLSQTVIPAKVYVANGGNVSLSCLESTGQQVAWMKSSVNSLVVINNDTNVTMNGSSLSIQEFQSSKHSGLYHCATTLSNKTTVSCPADIKHARIVASSFLINPTSTNAIVNSTVVLACSPPFSEPEAMVYWKKDGKMLDFTDTRLSNGGSLYISPVIGSDAGQYQCIAQNPITGSKRRSTVATLNVLGPPVNQTSPHNISVTPPLHSTVSGDRVMFECVASAYPPPLVMWEKLHSQTFPETAQVLSSGTLVIDPVTPDQGGVYRCIVSNELGRTSGDVELMVKEKPSFSSQPSADLSLSSGATHTLSWEVKGSGDLTALVLHNGQLLDSMTGNGPFTLSHTLNSVDQSDLGIYQCIVTATTGCVRSEVDVSIETPTTASPVTETTPTTASPVTETTPTTESTVTETTPTTESPVAETTHTTESPGSGDILPFTEPEELFVYVFPESVEFDGQPLNVSCYGFNASVLRWLDPDGYELPLVFQESGQLTTIVESPGNYTCRIELNGVTMDAMTTVYPRPFLMSVSPQVSGILGSSVRLECRIDGDGLNVEWRFGATELESLHIVRGNGFIQSYYYIDSLSLDHCGDYICRGRSDYSSHHLHATITLNVKIGPVLNLSREHIANRFRLFLVSWTPPSHIIQGYKLNWASIGSLPPLIARAALPPKITQFQNAFHEDVTLVIWPYYGKIDGAPAYIDLRRLELVRSCSVEARSSDSALLTLAPPMGGNLSYICNDAGITNHMTIPMATESIRLPDLLPSCNYSVKVKLIGGEAVYCTTVTPAGSVNLSSSAHRYDNGSVSLYWSLPAELRNNVQLMIDVNWGEGWFPVATQQHFPVHFVNDDSYVVVFRFRLHDWEGTSNVSVPAALHTQTPTTIPTATPVESELGIVYGIIFGSLLILCCFVLTVILVLKYIQVTRRETDKVSEKKEMERQTFRRMSMERVSVRSNKKSSPT